MALKKKGYSGDTDAKRLSRLAVYRRIEELQPKESRNGLAIVLAGPEAGEIGCLRDFLKMDGPSVVFVDKEPKGLVKVARDWPEALTFFSDMKNVQKHLIGTSNAISLINFDFCGYVTDANEKLVRNISHQVVDWGMVFTTFFRGRETFGNMERVQKAKATTLDGKRFVSTAQTLQKVLGPSFLPVFSLRYTGNQRIGPGKAKHGAMGILGFQRVPKGFQRNTHWMRMLESPSPYGGIIPSDERLLEAHLRVEALNLRKRGLGSKEVAAILNMNPGSVAAWFAMQSRQ